MIFQGKTYVHDRDENFEEYINSLGMPQERAAFFKLFKPVQKLEKNGDTYTLSANSPRENKQLSFKLGQEFDEVLSPKYVPKTKFTLDGNTLQEVQKFEDGSILTTIREYFDDKLIVTLTNNKWNGKATRYYKVKN